MEMFVLMVVILMSAIVITYSSEIYLYLCMVLGSFFNDVKNKVKSIIGRKK